MTEIKINSTVTERIERINFADGQRVPRGAVISTP